MILAKSFIFGLFLAYTLFLLTLGSNWDACETDPMDGNKWGFTFFDDKCQQLQNPTWTPEPKLLILDTPICCRSDENGCSWWSHIETADCKR